MTTILKTQRKTPGSRRESKRIAKGEPVTGEYREFCARMKIDLLKGVFQPGRPDPFPMRKPMVCRFCDYIAETDQIENDDDAHVKTMAARGGDPQHAEPAEYEPICVECGAINPFVEMMVCDECHDYPCTCQEG